MLKLCYEQGFQNGMFLQCNVENYHSHGTSLNRNKGNSGRPKTVTARGNVEEVRSLLEQNPHVSARKNGLGLSHTTFNRITRSELHFYPPELKFATNSRKVIFSGVNVFANGFYSNGGTDGLGVTL